MSIARAARPGGAKPQLSPTVTAALRSEAGEPLAESDRWSERVGADVSHARLVDTPAAHAAAEELFANAFAVGERIFFGRGQLNPGSSAGQELLRHELTHVAQQRGAAMPSYESLAITSPDDAVEVEARTGAGGVGDSDVVIARDGPPLIDATEYLERFSTQLARDLAQHVRGLPLATRVPHARWRANSAGFWSTLVEQLGSGSALVGALRPLLAPASLEALVDRGRARSSVMMAPEGRPEEAAPVVTGDGPAEWQRAVAIEVADVLARRVHDSLGRVIPRYLARRSEAQTAAWEAAGECRPELSPEPSLSALGLASALDERVGRALIEGQHLDVDSSAYRASGTSESGDGPLECRVVSLSPVPEQPHWVRADPPDATAAEVSMALYGSEVHAAELIDGHPLWGLPDFQGLTAAARDVVPAWVPVGRDPAADILASEHGAEAILAQSGDASDAVPDDVVRHMRDSVRLLDAMCESAAVFGLDGRVAGARERLDARSREVAAEPSRASRWGEQAERQRAVLSGAANGVYQAVEQLRSMQVPADDLGAHSLPQYVRETLRGLAEDYVQVAVVSDLVDTAEQRLAAADERSRLYPVELLEGILRDINQQLVGDGRSTERRADRAALRERQDRLRERTSVLRAQLIADPSSLGDALQELQAEIRDLQLETEMVVNMDALHDTFSILSDINGFWAWVSVQSGDLSALETEGRQWYSRWVGIWVEWHSGDREAAKAALEELRSDDGLRTYLQRVNDELQDSRVAMAIAQLAGMLLIAVVTMGVGAYVGAAAGTAGWSTAAAGRDHAGAARGAARSERRAPVADASRRAHALGRGARAQPVRRAA